MVRLGNASHVQVSFQLLIEHVPTGKSVTLRIICKTKPLSESLLLVTVCRQYVFASCVGKPKARHSNSSTAIHVTAHTSSVTDNDLHA